MTDRRATHAGIDAYNYYFDRNSGDNVLRLVDPGYKPSGMGPRMHLAMKPMLVPASFRG